ncbi:glycoside hydrolase family 32 protein [Butyrivibrio sp.]|uniref:glycoside hydrolase family 32 protein n=1 Tax=Butyrivibrio sp. TaxID=28121 RepID=UPI0025C0C5E3|nr:glycoside hydrolase family 32 protein [Butyrivibrio sp.]MBQ9301935.1 glycoside hydrolase family 32 protein [Butyrivibrio sp.]
MSDKLNKAREYEAKKEKMIPEEQRPLFHLTPRCGWMNDPNGFSFYKGEYHLFYQYYPYDTVWGPMHWGHAKSADLITWQYLPCAMAPDEQHDKDGCFSGSAIEMEDGKQLLVYTGVEKKEDEEGNIREVQTQCIALGDGTDYKKYENNPVIDSTTLPEGAGKYDFRDPKVWRENGKYYLVVGNKTEDKDGQILKYVSEDGIHWKYDKLVIKNNRRFGVMWECPDYFELDGKQLLMTSPQDMLPEELEFHNGNGTLCVIGHLDDNGDYCEENFQAIDYGIDFYAPQTILAADGRRIMIGWMQNWDTCGIRRDDFPWFGQMSFPREIWLENNKLMQKPAREIENYYGKRISRQNVLISDSASLSSIEGRCIDMTVKVRPTADDLSYKKFEIRFADNGKAFSTIEYDPEMNIVKIDRKHSGSRRAIVHQRRCKVANNKGQITLRLVLDRYSMELFINDGEQAMSMVILTDVKAEGISFKAQGELLMDVTMHELVRGKDE